MATLSSNLKLLMSSENINASELARRTQVAQPIIHRLTTGHNTNPKLATLKPIAEHFTITISQLIGEDPIPSRKTLQLAKAHQKRWSKVPMIQWEQAPEWLISHTTEKPFNDIIFMSTDADISEKAFSLEIKNSAMEPLFPKGTTIVVDPERSPRDNDFVVVHLQGESEPRLKKLVMDGCDHYLKSLNPALEGTKARKVSSLDQYIGVISQAKIDYDETHAE